MHGTAEKSCSPCSDDDDDEQIKSFNLPSTSSQRRIIISNKIPLESIQETDSNSHFCFGVKSYLHEFYDQSSITNNAYMERKKTKNKRLRLLWLITLSIGLLGLFIGSALLAYGHMSKEKIIIVENLENQMKIIDKNAIKYNYFLESCKIYGLLLFVFGGLIVCISLVMPSFICYKECLYKTEYYDYENNNFTQVNSNYNPVKRRIDFKLFEPQTKYSGGN
ncbi:unnamed protein product [Brachionus calyciflorus]|uniref:Uncharacterized protein n=1 Tax=Brachionus calyciflorus TaxID=104777 RepID=A0A813X9M2_9BILA|nr:unnamed protein product [Brachionus calyciflorus]